MATWYVDPDATGTGTGVGGGAAGDPTDSDNWTNAFTSIQDAIDEATLAAGDIVYCRGTEEPTSTIVFNGNKGTYTGGLIRFVGVVGLSGITGGRYHLSFGNSACSGVQFNDTDYITLENIEVSSTATGSVYIGMQTVTSNSTASFLINCYVHGWNGDGIDFYLQCQNFTLIRCKSSDNNGSGVKLYRSKALFCEASDSRGVGRGFYLSHQCLAFGCLAYNNYINFIFDGDSTCINCVSDDSRSDAGFYLAAQAAPTLIGCRSTNSFNYGFGGTRTAALLGCYADSSNSSGPVNTSLPFLYVNPDGNADWNSFSTSDTDQGYIDPDNNNYNLNSNIATLFDETLLLQDGTNEVHITAGLPPKKIPQTAYFFVNT